MVWRRTHTFGLLVLLAAIGLVAWFVPQPDTPATHLTAWLLVAALLLAFIALAGQGIVGLWRGSLIDERNKMSLARLQLLLWTVVVVSGYLAAAIVRVRTGVESPLAIGVPEELWIILGISTTSLVGSPLILATKASKPAPDQAVIAETRSLLVAQGAGPATLAEQGQVLTNTEPKASRWADMFRGDEVGNGAHLDLGKIQLFFFTLILVFAYLVAMGNLFESAAFDRFPELDASMLALLGISHAGYLANKAVPHTPTS